MKKDRMEKEKPIDSIISDDIIPPEGLPERWPDVQKVIEEARKIRKDKKEYWAARDEKKLKKIQPLFDELKKKIFPENAKEEGPAQKELF